MAYTYTAIEAEVRNNINNQTASVSTIIDQAINLLSNYFNLTKIDTSKSTVIGQDYIAKPTNCLEVMGVKVGDDYFDKIALKKLEEAEDYELDKFYEYNDQIKLIPTPTAVATCKIWYKAGFTALAGAGSTDVPDKLVPIIIVLATWLYFAKILSQTATAREYFPDATPEEMQKIKDGWGKQFKELLATIKREK